jgi:hypothetical protein
MSVVCIANFVGRVLAVFGALHLSLFGMSGSPSDGFSPDGPLAELLRLLRRPIVGSMPALDPMLHNARDLFSGGRCFSDPVAFGRLAGAG